MSGLPKGWVETRLGAVVELKYGKSLPKNSRTSGPFSVYGSNGIVGTNEDAITAAPAIIVGRKGSFGEVNYSPEECFPIDTTYYVDSFESVDPFFCYALLRYLPLKTLNRSTAIPGLNREDAYSLTFAIPPLAEQKRIVAKLDALNAKSARARTELARIETLVSRYKQAVLSKAFSGELTREWRNGRTGISSWRNLSLDQLISDGPTNGWSPKADGTSSGLKSLKLSATSSGKLRLDTETIKYLDQEISDNSKYWLLPNDILIQRANSLELLGTTVLFDGPLREFIYPDLMMRIRVNHAKINATYLATYLNSDPARSYFRAHATGTAGNMPKINGAVVRGTPVPTPVLDEQHEIVRRIESAFTKIDCLATQAKRALDLVGKLDEAILAKAFRGELVPQDESDEPAEKLLERIRAERAAAPKAKRGRGRKA